MTLSPNADSAFRKLLTTASCEEALAQILVALMRILGAALPANWYARLIVLVLEKAVLQQ